jgi:hypothetical protein
MSNDFNLCVHRDSQTHCGHINTNVEYSSEAAAYQQALEDFAISSLLRALTSFSPNLDSTRTTKEEAEVIAALLIEQLALSLNGEQLAAYLKAIRHTHQEVLPEPLTLQYPQSTELPDNFPSSISSPRYSEGEILQLRPVAVDGQTKAQTDEGICIGRYYAYNPHGCWMWKYVVWLDKNSLSASWCKATTAWEEHLGLFTQKEAV